MRHKIIGISWIISQGPAVFAAIIYQRINHLGLYTPIPSPVSSKPFDIIMYENELSTNADHRFFTWISATAGLLLYTVALIILIVRLVKRRFTLIEIIAFIAVLAIAIFAIANYRGELVSVPGL